MSNHFQDNIENILILKISKWNNMLLYLKGRVWNALFLKVKSQTTAYQHSCMLFASEERRKKNVKKKIGEKFLELNCCIFFLCFKKTYIGNTDSYSSPDLGKLHTSLATNDFLWFLLKFYKELSTTNLLTKKQVSRNSPFCW